MAKVDFGGVIRETCVEALPEAKVGDYTIVHAGFALTLLSEEEAQITLAALRELAELQDDPDFDGLPSGKPYPGNTSVSGLN